MNLKKRYIKLQAILFYTPRWLWKSWEGGKICALMMDLDVAVCSDIEKKQKKKLMIDYLWENLRFHNWWAYRYYFCEVLALINVVGEYLIVVYSVSPNDDRRIVLVYHVC